MLLKRWQFWSRFPLGSKLFTWGLGWLIPYTGSIGAEIIELERGRARVQLKDRRFVRNHLESIHAVALMNLGEFSTGLSVMSSISSELRAILVRLEVDYLKKARGTLVSSADFAFDSEAFSSSEQKKFEVEASIRDAQNDLVARVRAHWLIGPKRSA